MYRKLLTITLTAAALSACGDKPDNAPQLVCNDPAVLQSVRNNIQEIVKQEARACAQSDSRQFVDADKIIAAAGDLVINLDKPAQEMQNNTAVCSGTLTIQVPAAALSSAQTNSPLLYGSQSIDQLLQQRLGGSNLSYNGSGLFSQTLRYTPTAGESGTVINYEDNSLTLAAQAVSTVLRPYGIKDILVINGQPVRREDALSAASLPFPEPPMADPQEILEHNAASQALSAPPASAPAPEVLTPAAPPADEVTFSANDLEQARSNNRAADGEINTIWSRMDPAIQQRLLGEQRGWIQSKNNSCRQAAAQAGTTLQAEYLQLQCDTRMTRERSQYLRGYTIN